MLALTPGEPAGIGPDIVLLAGTALTKHVRLVLVGDVDMLFGRAAQLGLSIRLSPFSGRGEAPPVGTLEYIQVPCRHPVVAGELNSANAHYVLSTLDEAVSRVAKGQLDALVTAPVHKGVINDAGFSFTGHTEYLAARTGGTPVMMLAVPGLRVALATTHIPLSAVTQVLNESLLTRIIRILDADLRAKFAIERPRILACGVNPHAGEQGHIGREEVDWLDRTLQRLRAEGLCVDGPKPADTAFVPEVRANADVLLAMYHDQGLPALKALGFGQAVNVTLGLPILRTSVDHGTALALAGTGHVDVGSLAAAVGLAAELVLLRHKPMAVGGGQVLGRDA
ncbi:MAG: 4-hydroxythreonine-4-phosphate dehydrogenase PdxA [Gammaproteobacteria bacterium]|nr:4-hydroxythreonine-4-phosphate dehydrogenase PdxA [Gammaproteobacteria bacterium]